jgi:hypothetical protein
MKARISFERPGRHRFWPLLLAGLLALALLPATADAAILSFQANTSSTSAGSHPDFRVAFTLTSHETQIDPCDCKGDVREADAHLPTGLIGNPHATPQCSLADFSADHCPVDSQIGVARAEVAHLGSGEAGKSDQFLAPVFNLVPPPTEPGLLGFKSPLFDSSVFEVVRARTESDYGLDVGVVSIEHFFPLVGFEQITWGVPSSSAHDDLRFAFAQEPRLIVDIFGGPNQPMLCDAELQPSTDPSRIAEGCGNGVFVGGPVGDPQQLYPGGPYGGRPIPSNSPETPFLQNPTTCGFSSLQTGFDAYFYDGEHDFTSSLWPAMTSCDLLSFNPSQSIAPTTEAADSPSGAEFRLTVPQFESPNVPSPSELRAAHVTLPPGFALAPNVMNGKTTCSDAEARFGTAEEAHCPENAKLGTISVDTPVLPGPLNGGAYLGEPMPGNRYRMFLVFDGFAVHVKLPGTITPDPDTGQIQIDFQNLPQAPFETFNLHIFGSERGPLATPVRCGTYPVQSVFSPWDASLPDVTSRQFFTVDEGPGGTPCPNGPRPFHPGFQAASVSNTAAAHTSFSLNLTRRDGDQNLTALTVKTPPGFAATLKGIPYCPQAALNQLSDPLYSGLAELSAPVCSTSQLGTVTAGVGAGSHPLYLPGRVYLAGPYKGAPLSLEVVIPAVAGPYDLGNVAVRAAIHVDPSTARVTTVSDPLPQIVGGIPIRTRQILVNLDRPGFALNPTNCDPLSVSATLSGDEGALAGASSRFQVANCARLPFAPKLSLRLTGGVRRRGHPAIHAILRTQPGEANSRAISVTLPSNELLDNAHIHTVCTKVNFASHACPAGSLLGHATITTPLLDLPLTGNAYLRSSGSGLPDLALDLGGQFHIEALAHIDAVNGGLRTTFQTVPDVPLGTVALDLLGGAKGLIQNSESLCGADRKAAVIMRAQSGRSISGKVPLRAACGKQARRHKSRDNGSGRAGR